MQRHQKGRRDGSTEFVRAKPAADANRGSLRTSFSDQLVVRTVNFRRIRSSLLVAAENKANEEETILEKKQEEDATTKHEEQDLQEENKRREAISELLATEKNYVRDLNVVMSFFAELESKKIPVRKQLIFLFSNLDNIVSFHKEILEELSKREQEKGTIDKIGDLFSTKCDGFRIYATYCSEYLYFVEDLQRCRTNPLFDVFLKKRESSPDFRFMLLNDFLILPLQRLCRYPMLLQEVKKHTNKSHGDFQELTLACEKVRTVVDFVNEHTRRCEDFIGTSTATALSPSISPTPSPLASPVVPKDKKKSSTKKNTPEPPPQQKAKPQTNSTNLGTGESRSSEILQAIKDGDDARLNEILKQASEPSNQPSKVVLNIDREGSSALHVAVACGHPEICALLLKIYQPLVGVGDSRAWTPLHVACAAANTNSSPQKAQLFKAFDIVQLLLDNGADVSAQTETRNEPLHYFVRCFHGFSSDDGNVFGTNSELVSRCLKLLEIILAKGAKVNAVNLKGETPLFFASLGPNSEEIINFLLRQNADPCIPNKRGNTPLVSSIMLHRTSYVRLLLKHNPHLINQSDFEMLVKMARGHNETISILQEFKRKADWQPLEWLRGTSDKKRGRLQLNVNRRRSQSASNIWNSRIPKLGIRTDPQLAHSEEASSSSESTDLEMTNSTTSVIESEGFTVNSSGKNLSSSDVIGIKLDDQAISTGLNNNQQPQDPHKLHLNKRASILLTEIQLTQTEQVEQVEQVEQGGQVEQVANAFENEQDKQEEFSSFSYKIPLHLYDEYALEYELDFDETQDEGEDENSNETEDEEEEIQKYTEQFK